MLSIGGKSSCRFSYLMVEIFPVVHCENLEGHQQRPSNVVKASVSVIGVGSYICQTGVIDRTGTN